MSMRLQSSVAWIDFAEDNRRPMTEVISFFGERDTRDEGALTCRPDDKLGQPDTAFNGGARGSN